MRRRDASRAEVVRGGDKSATEVPLPDAIHDHARRQWILIAREPAREFQRGRWTSSVSELLSPEHIEELAWHLVAQIGGFAPFMQFRMMRNALGDRVGDGNHGTTRLKSRPRLVRPGQCDASSSQARQQPSKFGRRDMVERPADAVQAGGMCVGTRP